MAAFSSVHRFEDRHIGPSQQEQAEMLAALGVDSLDALTGQAVPAEIQLKEALNLPEPVSEAALLRALEELAGRNRVLKSYIGMGYYDCVTPPPIQRLIFENPAWYTPYTPYQAEIAQGRLESLMNFQTMVIDLTGLDVANASLLDEATAAAEAMTLLHRTQPRVWSVSACFRRCAPCWRRGRLRWGLSWCLLIRLWMTWRMSWRLA
jgi:glycine dehydrogenase